MTILILHGIEGRAESNWQPWLHDELVKLGHQVIMPTLPNPDHPDRTECLKTVINLVKDVDTSELIIVGHSLGVAAALDFIEQAKFPIKGLVAVAGFYEDYGAELNSYYMAERELDMSKVSKNLDEIYVLYGDDDPYVPQITLRNLATACGVSPRIFSQGGHLNKRAGFTEFPQLLDIITDIISSQTGTKFIDKLAFVHLQEQKILVTLSKGKDVWYIPGGKREMGETDFEALVREVQEEFTATIKPETILYYGTFKAQAHGKPAGTIVRMTCYLAEFSGEFKCSSEIEKLDYFTHAQKHLTSQVDWLIMDDLKEKGLLK